MAFDRSAAAARYVPRGASWGDSAGDEGSDGRGGDDDRCGTWNELDLRGVEVELVYGMVTPGPVVAPTVREDLIRHPIW